MDFNPITLNADELSYKDGQFYKGEEVVINKDQLSTFNYTFDNNGNVINSDLSEGDNIMLNKADFIAEFVTNFKPEEVIVTPVVVPSDFKYDPTKGHVDKDGNSIFKSEDLVDSNGKKILFNNVGDLVGEQGQVLKSFDDLIKDYVTLSNDNISDNDSSLVVNDLVKLTGIEVKDDKGAIIEFENSIAGIAKYVSEVRNMSKHEGVQEAIPSFFKANPDIYQAFLYKQTHGSIEGFGTQVDYRKINLGDEDVDQQEQIVRQVRLSKGDSKEEIDWYIVQAKADNKLLSLAKSGLTYLQNDIIKKEQDAIKIASEKDKQAKIEQDTHINNILGIVKSGSIKLKNELVVPIPEVIKRKDAEGKIIQSTKDEFIAYYLQPAWRLSNGEVLTNYERDLELESVEEDIFRALKKFTNGNEDQFITNAVNNNKVKNIKDILQKSKTPINSIFSNSQDANNKPLRFATNASGK
jgi:hypothetical protein